MLSAHVSELLALKERCLYLLFALRDPLTRVMVVRSLPVQEYMVDYCLA